MKKNKASVSPAQTEQKVRAAIAAELKKVNAAAYPNLYQRISDQSGYLAVESTIIDMMISTGLSPAACITTLETDY